MTMDHKPDRFVNCFFPPYGLRRCLRLKQAQHPHRRRWDGDEGHSWLRHGFCAVPRRDEPHESKRCAASLV